MANNILKITQSNINSAAVHNIDRLKAFPIYSGLGCFIGNQAFDADTESLGIYGNSEIMIDDIPISASTSYTASLYVYDSGIEIAFYYYEDINHKDVPLGDISQAFSDEGSSPQWNQFMVGINTPANATLMRWIIKNSNNNTIDITRLKLDVTNDPWSVGDAPDDSPYVNNDIYTETPDTWYKLFADYSKRHDNVYDGAYLQTRTIAQSQNLVASPFDTGYSYPTIISDPVTVDISAPSITNIEVIPEYLGQSSKIHIIVNPSEIPFAFRIGYTKTDSEAYTDWVPFDDFLYNLDVTGITSAGVITTATPHGLATATPVKLNQSSGNEIIADTTYYVKAIPGSTTTLNIVTSSNGTGTALAGALLEADAEKAFVLVALNEVIYDLNHNNFFDLTTSKPISANRKIWAQVIDDVGNLSQSDTISTMIYNVIKTDFAPPIGHVNFVSNSGQITELTNTPNLYLKFTDVMDNATDIKDIRYRDIIDSTAIWSNWMSYDTAIPHILESTNGLHRIEIQLRDYGNNITTCDSLYDLLLQSSSTNINTIFNTGASINNTAYIAGIKSKVFTTPDLSLYSTTAFGVGEVGYYVVRNNTDSIIPLKKNDRIPDIVLNTHTYSHKYDGDPPSNYYFYIDTATGTLVFGGLSVPSDANISLSINICRETAILYKWDKQALYKIVDFGFANEQAILSLCGVDNTLYIGTLAGNLYTYSNDILSSPIYSFADINTNTLPITFIIKHQFVHETEPYLYIGTGGTAFLYRSPLSNINSGTSWEELSNGIFNTTTDLLSATSAYNKLFIGTIDGKIIKYERTKGMETLINRFPDDIIEWSDTSKIYADGNPINTICACGNQVLAGIANKPEIWSYSEEYSDLPKIKSKYISIPLNNQSLDEPCAWDYYSNGLTVNPSDIVYTTVYDLYSPNRKKIIKEITGVSNNISILKLNKGSVWDKAIKKLFDNNTSNPKWTFEIEMMNKTGDTEVTRQGFKLSDGITGLDLLLSNNNIYIRSGSNSDSFNYKTTNDNITTFSEVSSMATDNIAGGGFGYPLEYSADMIGEPATDLYMYPLRGIKKLWNFTSSKENYGPYYTSVNGSTALAQNWTNDQFCLSVTADSDNNLCKIDLSIADVNNPRITNICEEDNIYTDTNSRIYIRLRYGNGATVTSLDNVNIKVALSADTNDKWNKPNWIKSPLVSTKDFATYILTPSYCGKVNAMAIEFDGLPETTRENIFIDYIAIANDLDTLVPIDITKNLVPIRVAVEYFDEDRARHNRLKIWIGRNPYPVFDKKDFLVSVTDTRSISLGKWNVYTSEIDCNSLDVTTKESGSIWLYGAIRFATNVVHAPVEKTINDFSLQWKYLSTGGISKIVNHRGTAYAITNGLLNIDGTGTDNPIDAWIKIHSFDANKEVWNEQSNNINKKCNLINALTVVPFDSNLIIAGEESSDFNSYDSITSPIIID